MLKDLLQILVPEKWFPWVIMLLAVAWIGWQTNTIYAIVERHYSESHLTVHYAQQTCIAVHSIANLDPKKCEE